VSRAAPGAAPRITVVTPSYMSVATIDDCIRSVLDQRYANLEYIVIDGGSTDGTVDVIRRYEEDLAWWTSERDRGQADALNKGFRRATGDLVCWLNSDDFFYPGAFDAAAAAYAAAPDSPFYFGNGYRVDRKGHKLSAFFEHGAVRFSREAMVFGLNHVLQPATFIRRAALEQVGLLEERFHYGLDTDLWIRLAELGEPYPIEQHLAASREYGETKTASGSFVRAEELRRIAEQHAGVAATPGSIAYYLDTLHGVAESRPDVFPPEYLPAIRQFWAQTAALFRNYGARPDGFPSPAAAQVALSSRPARPKGAGLRVGIELRQVRRGASGGIAMVLEDMLRALFARQRDVEFVIFCTVFNRDLVAVDAPNVEVVTLPLDGYYDELAKLAEAWGVDLLLRSYPTVEDVRFPLERQVFLIPDLQHEYHPEFFDEATLAARRAAFRIALDGAGGIVTISEHARRTIVEHASPQTHVFVASPSASAAFLAARAADATDEERRLVPEVPFFYFPANLWPHKNHEGLFAAFRRFLDSTGLEHELVLTGSGRGWQDLRQQYADLPIRHLGFVSAPLVRLLYEHATALAFCTYYEGFGIPVVEAFSVGTAVVCSDRTSLPEVADGAALMCDPSDVDAIADALVRVATDAQLRADLIRRGADRASSYTWEAGADQLFAGLLHVVENADAVPHEQPLVSIVTPSMNQGRFIRNTIESVLGQTYPNIEYIVIDGGSSDETLDILRSYGDRLSWISEPDEGQADAINKGLRQARGEILAYLNSDDVLLPHAVERVVDYLRQRPVCDLVYGDADYIDEDGQVTGAYPTAEYSFSRLMYDCCICQPAAFWRAEVRDVAGEFDARLHYAMDYEYWIRVDRSGLTIEHLAERLAQSRLYPETKTLSARRDIYREIFDVCRRRGGYVSQNYVYGLWDHLAFEAGWPWRILAPLPRTRTLLARAHHLLLNGETTPIVRSALSRAKRFTKRMLIRTLAKWPPALALAVATKRRLRALRARPPADNALEPSRPRVAGFWPDNWIAQRLEVVVDGRATKRRVRLVGRAVDRMSAEFRLNGTSLATFPLEQGRQSALEIDLGPGPAETLTVSFSRSLVDAAGRPVAFLLEETNLFEEDDLHASA
jgi:glycosyltransferase involved in cell wall biosynthesis